MKSAAVFIGDELSAAGFRLGGADAYTPVPGGEMSLFEWARQQAPMVLITAEVASRLPPEVVAQAVAAPSPLVLLLPDIRQRYQPPDVAQALRRQLGIEA